MGMKKFMLIRHGKTRGNLERRYIGDLEEQLCDEGIHDLYSLASSGDLPHIDALISSPAVRCRQTAEILFPNIFYRICPIYEIDFGVFKGKNANDLLGNKEYEAWLETNCTGDIPGGDSVHEFKNRCCDTFQSILEASQEGTTALVIHGGNIMAILERYALPKRNFYDYHVPNCGFFLCRYEYGNLKIERNGS
jgi:alpha-ribazole phosphatase